MCVFQDGAAVSRNAEDGDGSSPVVQQASSLQGDSTNDDGPSCNNNTVGIRTDYIS